MPTENSLPETLQRALEASTRDDTDNALRLLHQAAAETPSSALPQFLLGAELAQLGRIGEAEAAYANAVLLAPQFNIARYELGTLQFTSGRAALALVTWQPLLNAPDTDSLKLFVRGYAELAQDAFDAALDWFNRGMAANTANEALNANIRLLVAGVDKARASRPAQDPQPEQAADGAHFLLSNYGRQSSLH
jgi:Flp pilus assembly protein TadD